MSTASIYNKKNITPTPEVNSNKTSSDSLDQIIERFAVKPEGYWDYVFADFEIDDSSQFDFGDDHIPLRFD